MRRPGRRRARLSRTSTSKNSERTPTPSSSVRPRQNPASFASTDNTTWSFASNHSARLSRNVVVARSCRSCEGDGKTARSSSSEPSVTSTRVLVADGTIATWYLICLRVAVGRERAHRERDRVGRREPFSTWRNFLATHIRHRLCFSPLPRHRCPLLLGVVLSAILAPLMLGIREAAPGGPLELATDVLAVALTAVVRATDDEGPPAIPAGQREDDEVDHPSRTGENWTSTSETTTVPAYWRVHPPLVHRGLRWRPGPSLFSIRWSVLSEPT